MKVSTCVWASALLGVLLAGARGHAMPTPQVTDAQANPHGQPTPTMCMPPPRKLPPPTAPLAFTARIYMELLVLERRANAVVRNTLATLPGQSALKAPIRCERPRSAS
jgi:hypothetical protein